MFSHKKIVLAFLVIAGSFTLGYTYSSQKAIHLGLEVAKYPVNYTSSMLFDKENINYILQQIDKDPQGFFSLLKHKQDEISEEEKKEIENYINNNFTRFTWGTTTQDIKDLALPILFKLGSSSAILGGQQFCDVNSCNIENAMRLGGNALSTYYGIKSEGLGWIKRNAARLGILLLPMLGGGVARLSGYSGRLGGKNIWQWFSLLVNNAFDIKDYNNYCKNIWLTCVLAKREVLAEILYNYTSEDELLSTQAGNILKDFVHRALQDVSTIRRAIEIQSFNPSLPGAIGGVAGVLNQRLMARARENVGLPNYPRGSGGYERVREHESLPAHESTDELEQNQQQDTTSVCHYWYETLALLEYFKLLLENLVGQGRRKRSMEYQPMI